MPFIYNQGVKIHYETEGRGEALLILHGLTCKLDDWYRRNYVESLKNKYYLIMTDLRGHGKSDKLYNPYDYTIEKLTYDIISVLDELQLRKVHLLAYSMGARVGLGLLKLYPDRFSSVMLGGTSPCKPNIRIYNSYLRLFESGNEAMIDYYSSGPRELTSEEINDINELDLKAIRAFWIANNVSYVDVLPTINLPTLLFVGENDVWYNSLKKESSKIHDSTFVSIPGQGHEVMKKKDLILPHILSFLESLKIF